MADFTVEFYTLCELQSSVCSLSFLGCFKGGKRWIKCVFYLVPSCLRARPSVGDNPNEHWRHSHTPTEQMTSSSSSLLGNHLYSSISGYAVDQPLALTKSSHDMGVAAREWAAVSGTAERQQVRGLRALRRREEWVARQILRLFVFSPSESSLRYHLCPRKQPQLQPVALSHERLLPQPPR